MKTIGVLFLVFAVSLVANANAEIPGWIKTTAGWWSNDLIDDDTFTKSIQWLVDNNIITIHDAGLFQPTQAQPEPVQDDASAIIPFTPEYKVTAASETTVKQFESALVSTSSETSTETTVKPDFIRYIVASDCITADHETGQSDQAIIGNFYIGPTMCQLFSIEFNPVHNTNTTNLEFDITQAENISDGCVIGYTHGYTTEQELLDSIAQITPIKYISCDEGHFSIDLENMPSSNFGITIRPTNLSNTNYQLALIENITMH